MKILLFILLFVSLYTVKADALSSDAEQGKSFYPACHVCHNPEMAPPLGPPMWGVQRKYKKDTSNKDDFIKRMASFVKAPTIETAIHNHAVKQLGLMPPMPLPDEMLRQIATYIFEEQFPPPCEHWRIAVKRAEEKGDKQHAKKDQNQLNRFCQ
ncbi:MAG: cytochrome C [Gammaproteobacteria bacterium]|nr:MAG: cytochrome C [Gammaproteobacteria bacterium]